MLRSLREGVKGPAGKVLLAIIIVPFVFIGGMEFLRDGDADSAMKVNGESVSLGQLQDELAALRNEVANQLGENLTPEAISEARLLPIAKERLTDRVLMNQAIAAGGLVVPEKAVYETIVSSPEFQVDGKFSQDFMRQQVRNAGLSDRDLEQRVSDFLSRSQLQAGL